MKNKNLSARFIGKFSSIQSVIFATVAVLVLSAVVIVTGVSMKFTNTSIFENSSEYTHTIIQQMNQNIDSYIDYMENIAYLISSNEDVFRQAASKVILRLLRRLRGLSGSGSSKPNTSNAFSCWGATSPYLFSQSNT